MAGNALRGEQLLDKLSEAFERGLTIEGCADETGVKAATIYSTVRQWGLRVVTSKTLYDRHGQKVETKDLPELTPNEYKSLTTKSPNFYGYVARELEAGGNIPTFAARVDNLKSQTLYTNIKRAGYKIVETRELRYYRDNEPYVPTYNR